jgi:alkylation response protein AidB-like acyl-CoA dehydrogenase
MNDVTSANAIGAMICHGAADCDHREGDLAAEIALLCAEGWLQACLPHAHGGKGWGTEPSAALEAFNALRELGRANLSLARLFEGHMNAIKLVMLFGSPELRNEMAQLVHQGILLGVWGADEPADPVRLERAQDSFLLQGRKRFASGLGLVGRAIVTAILDDRPQMVLAATDDTARADHSEWRMSGMRATRSGTYDFSGVRTSRKSLVGKPGDLLREPWFEGGICVIAQRISGRPKRSMANFARHSSPADVTKRATSGDELPRVRRRSRRCACG